jgi:hypothetical protein
MPKKTIGLSNNLFDVLTQPEIGQLIDALFEVLTPELQKQAIDLLPPDTKQAVKQLLTPPQIHKTVPVIKVPTVSLAKQAQTWSRLWQDWDAIVLETSNEKGKYIVKEAEWEAPYFDTTTFVEDLEKVATQIQPLLQTAFDQGFTPASDFIVTLLEIEAEVAASIPKWMEIIDGLFLESHLTYCALQGEWLSIQAQGKDAFYYVQKICQYEQQFQEVNFDEDAVLDFLTQLSEEDQRIILTGLTANQKNSIWQRELNNTNSHWHLLYLYLIEQYAPDHYLGKLRETIPQRWQNGLPIIEELLATQNYPESLIVIEETLQALLDSQRIDTSWTPESGLLVTMSNFYMETGSVTQLLHFYQQTAQALNQTKRANALIIQELAIDQWLNWSIMFTAFAETPLTKSTHQALFTSWRDYVGHQLRPRNWDGYGKVKVVDSWWVIWLIDGAADPKKGASWFQKKINQWIANLPGDRMQLGANYHLLRLLTKDLTEIKQKGKSKYPQFYQSVICPQEFANHKDDRGDRSRQEYLQLLAPNDLLLQVLNYWKNNLLQFVPKPELAQKSDYTEHVRWMMALQELSPPDYQSLLAQWQTVHQRRSNLWQAMEQMGLK